MSIVACAVARSVIDGFLQFLLEVVRNVALCAAHVSDAPAAHKCARSRTSSVCSKSARARPWLSARVALSDAAPLFIELCVVRIEAEHARFAHFVRCVHARDTYESVISIGKGRFKFFSLNSEFVSALRPIN